MESILVEGKLREAVIDAAVAVHNILEIIEEESPGPTAAISYVHSLFFKEDMRYSLIYRSQEDLDQAIAEVSEKIKRQKAVPQIGVKV